MNYNPLLKIYFVIVCWFLMQGELNAQKMPTGQTDPLVQPTASSNKKPQKGDTLVYYQLLQLYTQHGKEYKMAVLAEGLVETTPGRTRMRIDYMLKRERVYLSRIFFAKVKVLEHNRVTVQREVFVKQMEQRYPEIQVWSVLHVDAYFQ